MNNLSLLELIKRIYSVRELRTTVCKRQRKSIDNLDARIASRGYDVIAAGCIEKSIL